ncbi:MAG: DUF4279 domain-containing protein [Dehalococcoidia bacterium]
MTSRPDEPAGAQKWEIRVSLDIYHFPGTLEELTRRMGVAPDQSLAAGEPIAGGRKVRAYDRWVIDAGTDHEAPLQEQLRILLGRVLPLAPRLSALPPPTSVMISCGVLDYTRDVSLHFDPEVIAAAASMNASLDVDYYDMSPKE